MKKIVYSLVALAMFGASFSAWSLNTPAQTVSVTNNTANVSTATKVGVLDMRQIMEKSVQIAQIREKLQKDFKPKQDKLATASNTLKNDTDQLRRENPTLKDDERKKLSEKIIKGEQELQRMQSNLQQEFMVAQNKELKVFLGNLKDVVAKIAKTNNLGVVITKDTVAYVAADLDITSRVIQQIPHK